MAVSLRVLIIEDSHAEALLTIQELQRGGFAPSWLLVASRDELAEALKEPWDLVISDYQMPGFGAMEALEMVLQRNLDVPFIIVSGRMGEELAVMSVKAGAHDYVMKDNLLRLSAAVHRELREATGRKHRREAEQQLHTANRNLALRTEQLQALAAELTRVQQRERRRLAQSLHDNLQQLLVTAKLNVGLLRGRHIDEDLRSGLRQVDDLLDQSIQASRTLTIELSPPILYDAGLTAGLQWLGRWMKENHNLQITITSDPNIDKAAEDVKVLLFQATRELLFNVVKHSGAAEAMVEANLRPDGCIEIKVEDNGTGFNPADIHSGDSHLTGGFGLFSMRERLQMLGGGMQISSAPGAGAVVTVHAPLHMEDSPPEASQTLQRSSVLKSMLPIPRRAQSGVVRVLLADDHKIVREGLAGLMEEENDIDVVGEAVDGEMAVELARELRPDVIIMDVSMPRLNGVEATRRIMAELPEVRIIGLSMHEEADMATAMREAGAADYLTKDGPSEILIGSIRECLKC